MESWESWKIVKDKARCERPGCPLTGTSEYWAVLELPACVRREMCEPCFRELSAHSQEPPLYWRGKRRAKPTEGPVLDLLSLRTLFDRLGEQTDPEKAAVAAELRYMVALLLLRKRVLRIVEPRGAEQEGADLVVVDPKIEGMQPVALIAPELDSARLGTLKDELLAMIEA